MTAEPLDYDDGYHDGYIDALKEVLRGDITDIIAHLAEMIGNPDELDYILDEEEE